MFASIHRLTLDFNRFYVQCDTCHLPPGGPTAAAELVAACCTALWPCLPSLTGLQLVWPSDVQLLLQPPSLAPLKRLTSLLLRAEASGGKADTGLGEEEVLGLLALLWQPRTLQQLELRLDLTAWGAHQCIQDHMLDEDAAGKAQLPPAAQREQEQLANPAEGKQQQQLADPARRKKGQLQEQAVRSALLLWLGSFLHFKLPCLKRLQLGPWFIRLPVTPHFQQHVSEMMAQLRALP
jgi:hypothetical protein